MLTKLKKEDGSDEGSKFKITFKSKDDFIQYLCKYSRFIEAAKSNRMFMSSTLESLTETWIDNTVP